MTKWEKLFREANKLRADAFRLDCARLHALASLKMEELQRLVREGDAEDVAAARAEDPRTAVRPRVRFSLTLELGRAER